MADLGLVALCVGTNATVTNYQYGRSSNLLICQNGEFQQVPLQSLMTHFDFSSIPPEQIAAYFGSGFLLYVFFWGVGVGLKALKTTLNL